jgi:hypothetical protein
VQKQNRVHQARIGKEMVCPRGAEIDGGYFYPRNSQNANASIAGEQFGWKKRTVEVRASTVWDIEIHPG